MLNKKTIVYIVLLTGFIYTCLLIAGCGTNNDAPDISGMSLTIRAERFERDLFESDSLHTTESIHSLQEKYRNFFNLFAFQITTLGSRDPVLMTDNFRKFITDTNFRRIYADCEKQFGNFDLFNENFTKAFRYYSLYFPGKIIPRLITMISGFSYPVICDSLTLGVGLDMYLGPQYKYYSTLEPPLPAYLRSRMNREYIVCDALKGWATSDYGIDESTARMIDFMVSQGRLLFFLDKVVPDSPDTIKTGYSSKQLEWCKANEKKIWSFFIDNKLLFSFDPNLMNKYVNDGPTTNGFPKDSPGNIGQFIGWQIVKSFMKNHPEITLQKLMDQKDMLKIFNDSKYKPTK